MSTDGRSAIADEPVRLRAERVHSVEQVTTRSATGRNSRGSAGGARSPNGRGTHAQTNLVRLPDALGFAAAASWAAASPLRTARWSSRADWLPTRPCWSAAVGLGLAAIQIGISLGARVVGVDPFPAARAAAEQLGARTASTIAEARALVDGAHVAVDAYGSAESAEAAYASLRKRGRHIQVGLLAGAAAFPRLNLGRAITEELEIRGSHGMAAHEYPAMLARIAAGDPIRE